MRPILLSFAALAVLAAGLRADEAVLLRYQMGPEDRLTYRTASSMKQKQTTGQRTIETSFTQTETELRTLDGVGEDGNLRIKKQNRQLEAELDLGGQGDYRFDSTAADRPQGTALARDLNPFFERLHGSELQFVHSPRGEVLSVQGYRQLFGNSLEGNNLALRFAGGGSDRFFRFGVSELFVVFSEEAVAPGDTWEVDLEADLPSLGTVTGKKVYTFEGTDEVDGRTVARIAISTRLELAVNSRTEDATVTGRLSALNSAGRAEFDLERGQLLSLRNSYTLAGTLSVENQGRATPITTEQVRTVRLDLLEERPLPGP